MDLFVTFLFLLTSELLLQSRRIKVSLMLKSKLFFVLLVIVILVTACGDQGKIELKANNTASMEEAVSLSQYDSQSSQDGGISTSQPLEQLETKEETIEYSDLTISNFEAKLLIVLKSYEDQLTEEKQPILTALENNLIALVEHDSTEFRSGFVTEELADHMMVYYGEELHYRFTDIESIEPNMSYGNVHITILGQRLNTTSYTIEDVKMMYAFRQNDQGHWMIYTID